MKTRGERIKELRKEYNVTQKQLSQATHIAQSTISGWEQELFEPTASAIKLLCFFFDVSADYLIGIEDETGAKIKNHIYDNHGNITFNQH